MKLRIVANGKPSNVKAKSVGERKPRKPKWDPSIKHKTETYVSIPNIPIKGIDQDLVAKLEWDPVSQGWEGQVDVMDTTVKAWGLKPKELQKSLIEKVQDLVHDMGWDAAPIRASWISRTHQAFVIKLVPNKKASSKHLASLCCLCEEPLRDQDEVVTVWDTTGESLAHKECADSDSDLKCCHGCDDYFYQDDMSKADPDYCKYCEEED